MNYDDECWLDVITPDVLADLVELRKETVGLRPDERKRVEQEGYGLLRVRSSTDPDFTPALQQRVLALARSRHREAFALWLEDLFDRTREHPPDSRCLVCTGQSRCQPALFGGAGSPTTAGELLRCNI